MNSLKNQIDSCFMDYEYKADCKELFQRYEKRRKSFKIFLASFSGVIIIFVVFLNLGGVNPVLNNHLGLKAAAVTDKVGNNEFNNEKTLLKNSKGVKRITKKISYDKNGIECINVKKAKSTGYRDIITPAPIELKVFGEDIEKISVDCGENGFIYSEKNDNLKGKKTAYKNNDKVNWIPNCKKLTASLSADVSKFPSDKKNDALITKELRELLKTEADYNKFFGDTVIIKAYNRDKSTDSVSVKISLDKYGRYYIAVKE